MILRELKIFKKMEFVSCIKQWLKFLIKGKYNFHSVPCTSVCLEGLWTVRACLSLKTEDLFFSLESDCLYMLCIYCAFFCLPGVMLKHLVICEQLLCCSVNWARQIIPDTVSAPYCKSNLDLHSPFSAHGMHQMPGPSHLSGNGRKPGSTAPGSLSDPSLIPWTVLLFISFVHCAVIL